MELLLLRHGEAEARAASDEARPLTQHGIRQANAAMIWLAGSSWRPQHMLISPYRRARATAKPLRDLWSHLPTATDERLSPDSTPETLLEAVAATGAQRVMIIGHNPVLGNTAQWLLDCEHPLPLGTASMALLRAEVLEKGCAELVWLRHYPDYGHPAVM